MSGYAHVDLIEFADGIYLRLLPVRKPPEFRDIDIRCAHTVPTLIYKPGIEYRLRATPVDTISGTLVFVARGAAEGNAPDCGCWMPIAVGGLVMDGPTYHNDVQVNMTVMNPEIGP